MFALPKLPYAYDALAPDMSERTLRFHHDKHHRTYVEKTNALLEKSGERAGALEDVVRKAASKGKEGVTLFNNAAQAWNHAFFWECMSPRTSEPTGRLADAIGKSFGDIGKLGETFVKEGAAHFGSGWVWLTTDTSGALAIETTHDARDLLSEPAHKPVLVCDLWEHAYYLDRQNDREGFLKTWIAGLANWEFAGRQFDAARGEGQAWRYPAQVEHAESRCEESLSPLRGENAGATTFSALPGRAACSGEIQDPGVLSEGPFFIKILGPGWPRGSLPSGRPVAGPGGSASRISGVLGGAARRRRTVKSPTVKHRIIGAIHRRYGWSDGHVPPLFRASRATADPGSGHSSETPGSLIKRLGP